jgi:hypothetical protein
MATLINNTNIQELLAVGQIFKNSDRRYFRVETLDETSISIQQIKPDGPDGRKLSLSRSTFIALFKNKTYEHIRFFSQDENGRWREKSDLGLEGQIGANRFMACK